MNEASGWLCMAHEEQDGKDQVWISWYLDTIMPIAARMVLDQYYIPSIQNSMCIQ